MHKIKHEEQLSLYLDRDLCLSLFLSSLTLSLALRSSLWKSSSPSRLLLPRCLSLSDLYLWRSTNHFIYEFTQENHHKLYQYMSGIAAADGHSCIKKLFRQYNRFYWLLPYFAPWGEQSLSAQTSYFLIKLRFFFHLATLIESKSRIRSEWRTKQQIQIEKWIINAELVHNLNFELYNYWNILVAMIE